VHEAQHEAIARWERRWMAAMGAMLVLLVVFIVYSLAVEGAHIGQRAERGTPADLTRLEMFQSPGVMQTGPNEFRVSVVGQAFSFAPAVIQLPEGAEVTFFASSRDVLHGYHVAGTNINVELIPGEVATWRYTFREPGEYRVSCNEYCGISHQNMIGTIQVLPAAEYAALQEQRAAAPPADGEAAGAASVELGEQVYASNCVACHQANGQGLAGVFPPLSGHAADLYAAEGGREYLVNVLLYGLMGAIQVEGGAYSGVMPAWSQLTDEQIAAVLNYVLASWDNAGEVEDLPYAAADVAALRGQGLTPDQVLGLRAQLDLER